MKISEYVTYDGLGLAELVKSGQVSASELVDTAIQIIEKTNPDVNAVVHEQFDSARKNASQNRLNGPFAGVPFLLKDMGAFEADVPSTFGSEYCKNFKIAEDSELVARFKKAGFIILGRTNAPEFGLHPTTEPRFRGATKNPWNIEHTPGGSSGGAAAAVASGVVPIAHASDGGGSIRIPASCCGLFGLKPNEGRSPVGPSGGRMWHGLAVEHVLTRTVRDSAAVLDIVGARQIGGPILAPQHETSFAEQLKKPLKNLKIAYVETPFAPSELHDDCRQAALDTARLCEQLGHEVDPHKLKLNVEEITKAYLVIIAGEKTAFINRVTELLGRRPRASDMEPTSFLCAMGGNIFKAADYAEAVATMDRTRRDVVRSFEDYDMVLTPTLALPPPKLGTLMPSAKEERMLKFVQALPLPGLVRKAFQKIPEIGFKFCPYTFLFNITGQPAMSVPLHWNDAGLPMGTQFAARHGEEGALLRLAKQLDEARSFGQKKSQIMQGLC